MHKENRARMWAAGAMALVALGVGTSAEAQQANMTFFVTSAGPGKGADLGGLSGADAYCQSLAQSGRRGQPHLAGLPEHQRRRRHGGGECT